MNKAIILIPIYKEKTDAYESLSLMQAVRILGKHRIAFFAPESLNTGFYEEFCRQNNIEFAVERFDDFCFQHLYGYNDLLKNKDFYGRFLDYEYMLIYQLDAYVFKDELLYWCEKGYDYIGAPWFKDFGRATENSEMLLYSGNGGFSLRKNRTFFDLYSSDAVKPFLENKKIPEDILIGTILVNHFNHLNIAKSEEAKYFAFECQPRRLYREINNSLPFGCHAWRNYDPAFWREFIIVD